MNALDSTFRDLLEAHGLPKDMMETLPTVYRPVLTWLAAQRAQKGTTVFIGVNGAQGSGKTTFCSLLVPLLHEAHGLRGVTLSIDDVYLPRESRIELGTNVHPLCEVRGVPGTHDVPLTHKVFDALQGLQRGEKTAIPRFDKARDDRKSQDKWDQVEGPVDVVFFEGWCVGCPPLPPWEGPYNEREKQEDSEGIWSRWSADALDREYTDLFGRLHGLIFIRVPSMDTVRNSRWLQEKKLWDAHEKSGNKKALVGLMTRSEVNDYVALFERYTEHMFTRMEAHADILIERDENFRYSLNQSPDSSNQEKA